MKFDIPRAYRGFTLLELSIVLAIIGIVIGGGLAITIGSLQASQYNATVAEMENIERALLNYSITFNRIPCPSDLTQTQGTTTYGVEAANRGTCFGGTPSANFQAPSGSVEGGIPTRTLQLPDNYMYDGWGRKLRYAVDPTYTASKSLPASVHSLCSTASAKAITVDDASGAARTTSGLYAIISHGANGHGAYTSAGVTLNAGSVNANELTNCHCNSSGATTTYQPTYVEMAPTQDPTTTLDNFDDLVTFKEAWQMQAPNYTLSQIPAQCVYVADTYNNRVEVFNTSGTFVMGIGAGYNGVSGSIGSPGSGNGQLTSPMGLALDTSGNLWVAEYNNRIDEFSSIGKFIQSFGAAGGYSGQFFGSRAIAIDGRANVWVTDEYNNRVQEFSSSGNFLMSVGGTSTACTNCGCTGASCPTNSGSGNGQFYQPYGVTVDASGNVWVADYVNYRLEQFSNLGAYKTQFPTTPLNYVFPTGIHIDNAGNIWVASIGPSVQEYTSSGTLIKTIGNGYNGVSGSQGYGGSGTGQLNTVTDFSFDASGNIWMTDQQNNRVVEYNNAGSYLTEFGSAGTANGQFNSSYSPSGIAIGNR